MYRANLFMWMIVGAIGPIIMTLVWFAVLREKADIGGYGRSDFVIYYLLTTLSWYVVGGEFARPVGTAIRFGDINKSLLQPYDVVLGKAVWEQAWKVLSLILSLPAVAIILYATRSFVTFHFDIHRLPYVVLSLAAGALVFAFLQAIIGISAFWVTQVWPFVEMNDMFLQLLGGILAPIALLPPAVQRISAFLPYRYTFYEPVAIIMGKTAEPLPVILRQSLFAVILYIVYRLLWRAGIRKYEAVGG
jgi:ABC-2 type transport system permease protein